MKIIRTELDKILIIEPEIFHDSRGYFFESYSFQEFNRFGISIRLVQDNQSYSTRNVVRGLHYQIGENAQSKLIRVVTGKILDIAVDIRFGSPSFGRYTATELSAENKLQLWLPAGFAHGFSVLSDDATVIYKCTKPYSPKDERGIVYNDPELGIDWKITTPIVSEKDRSLPLFKDIKADFIYE
ncbi:MAG: dTDP-4-dehydrorhamnose 3,5-epimerase [Candidatus Cloacimonadota bacterium]|nr:MAG: dTDP-4-dehydrorhamnose 3,5-epimerase [Candidatus Cloacimonadota bacterium]